jgi:hypothetical protein
MGKKPRVGSRAWEEALARDPTYARNMIKTLTDRAKQGHPEAADSVLRWLEKFPELKPTVWELDDLSVKAEAAWVRAVAFGDPLSERAAREEIAELKSGLLGPAPSITEKILASAVLVAYMSYQRAALVAAQKADHPAVQEARDRRLANAQKRLLAAIKGWELIAGKKANGLRPKGRLKLFEPDPEAA